MTSLLSLLLISSIASAATPCKNFTVISHRGLSGRAPEESKIAYELAADLHTDFLEMDLHRTKDGVLIVTHDDTFERTTNIAKVFPTRAKALISTLNFNEIEKLETGTAFNQAHPEFANPKFVGQKILNLEQVVNLALHHPAHPGLYIETKSPELYPGIEKGLVDLLQRKNFF